MKTHWGRKLVSFQKSQLHNKQCLFTTRRKFILFVRKRKHTGDSVCDAVSPSMSTRPSQHGNQIKHAGGFLGTSGGGSSAFSYPLSASHFTRTYSSVDAGDRWEVGQWILHHPHCLYFPEEKYPNSLKNSSGCGDSLPVLGCDPALRQCFPDFKLHRVKIGFKAIF